MKFALHSVSYSGTWGGVALPFEKFLDRAKSFGYEAVEVMAKRPHISPVDYAKSDDRKRLGDLIASKGLEVACIADYHDWCWDGIHGDMPHHEKELLWLQANCQLAADLQCPFVRTFSGNLYPTVPYQQQWGYCVNHLREGAKFAESLGVTILLQNHQGFTSHYQDVLNMVREINHPSLKMQLDPMYIQQVQVPMAKAVEDCADLVMYSVTSSDRRRDTALFDGKAGADGLWQRVFEIKAVGLDEGEEDIRGFLAALKGRGFKGPYIGYEVCGMPLRGGTLDVIDDMCRRSLRFLLDMWKAV